MPATATATATTDAILDRLSTEYQALPTQLRRAADYVLNNPNEVGVTSMRQLAQNAEVNPNSFVRMARAIGFDSYQSFRQPFREHLVKSGENFPDRARWLQSLAQGGRHDGLLGEMAATAIDNIEQLFAQTSAAELKAAADAIVGADRAFILGVGVAFSLANNAWYVGRMALDHLIQVPRPGNLPIDDIATIGPGDLLLAMTFTPYRGEVVAAVELARKRGAKVIAISDSRTAPIAFGAEHLFVVPTDSPQFFTSSVAILALLECITAFMVADADQAVVERIDSFHQLRHETGVYWSDKA